LDFLLAGRQKKGKAKGCRRVKSLPILPRQKFPPSSEINKESRILLYAQRGTTRKEFSRSGDLDRLEVTEHAVRPSFSLFWMTPGERVLDYPGVVLVPLASHHA